MNKKLYVPSIMETALCETDHFKSPTYKVKGGFEGVK